MLKCIEDAAEIAGLTIGELADRIGANRVAMYRWKRVPLRYVPRIEKVQQVARRKPMITRFIMRPDHYKKRGG
jgi:hypothetical protein